jgi:hypothetical protein
LPSKTSRAFNSVTDLFTKKSGDIFFPSIGNLDCRFGIKVINFRPPL